jgi:hypothetical protein
MDYATGKSLPQEEIDKLLNGGHDGDYNEEYNAEGDDQEEPKQ